MQYYELGYFDSHRESLTLLGDQDMWEELTDNLYPIPKDTLDNVMSDCVFLMLNETKIRGGGFVHKKLIEGKSVIAFCNLHSRDSEKQRHMILHEIAHCVLGHTVEGLSDEEYYKQEREANSLVDKWENDRKEYCEKQTSDLGL